MRAEVIYFVDRALNDWHQLHENPPGKVLDIGSMDINGTVRPQFEKRGWKYTGIDSEEGKNVDMICDVSKIPEMYLRFGAFDCVTCLEVVEHLNDPVTAIRDAKTVLRPGGLLVISAAANGFPLHRHPIDCWRIMPDGMVYLMAGCRDVEIAVTGEGVNPGIMGRGIKL